MKVGDLVMINNAPFGKNSLFIYENGDLGILREKIRDVNNTHITCIVMLLRDFKNYHIPMTYMKKMDPPC